MADIRNIDLGTFVSSADATARVRSVTDRSQQRVERRTEDDHHGGHGHDEAPGDDVGEAYEEEDAGTYTPSGTYEHPHDDPDDGEEPPTRHLNVVV